MLRGSYDQITNIKIELRSRYDEVKSYTILLRSYQLTYEPPDRVMTELRASRGCSDGVTRVLRWCYDGGTSEALETNRLTRRSTHEFNKPVY